MAGNLIVLINAVHSLYAGRLSICTVHGPDTLHILFGFACESTSGLFCSKLIKGQTNCVRALQARSDCLLDASLCIPLSSWYCRCGTRLITESASCSTQLHVLVWVATFLLLFSTQVVLTCIYEASCRASYGAGLTSCYLSIMMTHYDFTSHSELCDDRNAIRKLGIGNSLCIAE